MRAAITDRRLEAIAGAPAATVSTPGISLVGKDGDQARTMIWIAQSPWQFPTANSIILRLGINAGTYAAIRLFATPSGLQSFAQNGQGSDTTLNQSIGLSSPPRAIACRWNGTTVIVRMKENVVSGTYANPVGLSSKAELAALGDGLAVVYNRALPNAECDRVIAWLTQRYQITI